MTQTQIVKRPIKTATEIDVRTPRGVQLPWLI